MLKLTALFDKRKLLATGERLVLKQQRPTPPPPKNFYLATPGIRAAALRGLIRPRVLV